MTEAGWEYRLFDFDPDTDGDEEAWATALAEQGWRSWDAGAGPWVTIGVRRVRRWSLRRHPVTERGDPV